MNEDICGLESYVLMHEKSPFLPAMRIQSEKLGFRLKVYKDKRDDVWLRDYIMQINGNIYTPGRPTTSNPDLIKETSLLNKNDSRLYYSLLVNKSLQYPHNNYHPQIFLGHQKVYVQNKIALEGGNMFCAKNKDNKLFLIIGENVLLSTAAYVRENDPQWKNHPIIGKSHHYNLTQGYDIEFLQLRDYCKYLITSSLGFEKKQLIVIPQWTYHIDLQMCYVGNGQFCVNTFALPKKNHLQTDIDYEHDGNIQPLDEDEKMDFIVDWPKPKNSFFGYKEKTGPLASGYNMKVSQIKGPYQNLEKLEKNIVDVIVKKLKKKNFDVTKVFGTAFVPNGLNGKFYNLHKCTNTSKSGAISLLNNGILIKSPKTGKRHFITANAVDQTSQLKDYFSYKLKELEVEVEYIDIDLKSDFIENKVRKINSTLDYVEVFEGSVRCQTSIIQDMNLDKEYEPKTVWVARERGG
ncbi:hypothetical protein FRA_24c00300 [Francisella sp. W12-1067]|nr:hypothetical protein FRA_24c00300 [Francisella sp. W12-1067]